MDSRINTELNKILLNHKDKYFVGNTLNKSVVIDDLYDLDSRLIGDLLQNKLLRKHFIKEIAGHSVINTQKLIKVLEMNSFWNDSLTQYENKIGLTINGKYLDEKTDVVLDFPYKDTILKASMSKEDLDKDESKPEEPFLNELIEAEEIDQLLDKKILVNAKRYSSGKAEKAVNLSDTDNLILKGNNLIALSSILERYKGKVKCIYIDPPYNTGGDSFNYNDRFNRSTWLTFMKNRLEISKELLRDDGVIFVSLSDEEAHYCKVLMDGIFGENNFLNDIIWNSTKSVTNTAIISVSHTHTLTYFRNKDYYVKNRTEFRLPEDSEGFDNPDNDPRGPWKADPFQVGGWRPNQQYEIVNPNTGVSYFPNEGNSWKNDYKKFKELVKDNRIVFGVNGTAGPQRKRFLSEAKERGRVAKTIWDDLGTTTNGTQHMKQLFGKAVFKNPKPEQFIRRIIELATEPDDIILDFFVGSGTTCSTAHKMGRRYIGIEQMNYIKDITLKRMEKVIDGEQGGISKEVDWQGGGSFVYAELMEKSRGYIDRVMKADNPHELVSVYETMLENVDLEFRADLDAIREMIEDTSVSFEDKKRTLIKAIDKNQLYYNYSEIDDKNVRDLISDSDYAFNQSFYSEGNE